MIASRRNFLLGATAFLAAPSIVRAGSLMPVSVAPVDGLVFVTAPRTVTVSRLAGNWLITDGSGFVSWDDGYLRFEHGPSVTLPAHTPDGMGFSISIAQAAE